MKWCSVFAILLAVLNVAQAFETSSSKGKETPAAGTPAAPARELEVEHHYHNCVIHHHPGGNDVEECEDEDEVIDEDAPFNAPSGADPTPAAGKPINKQKHNKNKNKNHHGAGTRSGGTPADATPAGNVNHHPHTHEPSPNSVPWLCASIGVVSMLAIGLAVLLYRTRRQLRTIREEVSWKSRNGVWHAKGGGGFNRSGSIVTGCVVPDRFALPDLTTDMQEFQIQPAQDANFGRSGTWAGGGRNMAGMNRGQTFDMGNSHEVTGIDSNFNRGNINQGFYDQPKVQSVLTRATTSGSGSGNSGGGGSLEEDRFTIQEQKRVIQEQDAIIRQQQSERHVMFEQFTRRDSGPLPAHDPDLELEMRTIAHQQSSTNYHLGESYGNSSAPPAPSRVPTSCFSLTSPSNGPNIVSANQPVKISHDVLEDPNTIVLGEVIDIATAAPVIHPNAHEYQD